jgi:hypothetical protein
VTTHIYDGTNFYNVASPGTGAANGDFFVFTAANIDASINGINQNLIIMGSDQDTLIESGGGQASYIYPEGTNDAIVPVNEGTQAIIDLGKGTILDVQNNLNGFDLLYNQPTNDPGFNLIVPQTGYDGLLFLVGVQLTTADLTPPNGNGVQTLTMKNGATTTDTMNVIGLGSGTLTLANASGGVYLTQGNPFIHGVTV